MFLSLCKANVEAKDFGKILKAFLSLERLDKSWTARLKALKKASFTTNTDQNLALYAEQFLSNGLYRHLCDAEDAYAVRAKTIACVFGWWIIKSIYEQERVLNSDGFSLLVDVVRAYSVEVEYSDRNLYKLFALANKFIKV